MHDGWYMWHVDAAPGVSLKTSRDVPERQRPVTAGSEVTGCSHGVQKTSQDVSFLPRVTPTRLLAVTGGHLDSKTHCEKGLSFPCAAPVAAPSATSPWSSTLICPRAWPPRHPQACRLLPPPRVRLSSRRDTRRSSSPQVASRQCTSTPSSPVTHRRGRSHLVREAHWTADEPSGVP